jgi:hypothetical protein
MENWLRTGTVERKLNDTGEAITNSDSRVAAFSESRSITGEEASSSKKNIAENMTVHIWNSGLLGVVMQVSRNLSVLCVMKCCRMNA